MLGKRIRQLRIENNLTMIELSKLCKVSQSYISDLENGKIKNPSIIKIEKIAAALGVPVIELLNNNYDKSKYELEKALLNGSNDISKLVSNLENSAKEETINSFRNLIEVLDWKSFANISDDDIYDVVNSQDLYRYLSLLFFEKLNKRK
ncbi:helix-turn-helix domain-containing protein [Intestinibacter bartlettii]|uniref:helix-turn-helix domain-containing protein n=1 Tax=Intestinibacter bartlettii TaxID=261299 RepID=UPI0039F49AC6